MKKADENKIYTHAGKNLLENDKDFSKKYFDVSLADTIKLLRFRKVTQQG